MINGSEAGSRRTLLNSISYAAVGLLAVAVPGIAAILWNDVVTTSHNSYRIENLERRMEASESDRRDMSRRIDQDDENLYLLCRANPQNVCRIRDNPR